MTEVNTLKVGPGRRNRGPRYRGFLVLRREKSEGSSSEVGAGKKLSGWVNTQWKSRRKGVGVI